MRPGEVVFEGYNEKDINEDGNPECEYLIQVRLIAEVSVMTRILFIMLLVIVLCLIFFQMRGNKKEDK